VSELQQHEQALRRAQCVRLGAAAVRSEIRAGSLPVAEALFDPRARPILLGRLLGAQRGWGETRIRALLRALRNATRGDQVVDLHPGTPVRRLTDRQKHALAAHLRDRSS
jgi:hypothetical protein